MPETAGTKRVTRARGRTDCSGSYFCDEALDVGFPEEQLVCEKRSHHEGRKRVLMRDACHKWFAVGTAFVQRSMASMSRNDRSYLQ
jgi:hypothetical protein